MYNISPLYTGENSAVKLPELDSIERLSRRNSEMQVKGEETKMDKALKDKASFQKMLSIDPIMAVSTFNATRQAKDLEVYNNKWADKYVKSKGQLSFADEMEMSKDRKMLEATQGKMLADQEQYKVYKNTILRDTRGYYDKAQFDAAEQEYFKTGELPPNMMDVAPQDFAMALSKSELLGTPGMKTDIQTVTDSTGKTTRWATDYDTVMTENEAIDYIPKFALSNEAYLKGILRDFKSIPEKEQLAAVGDYNRDGVVDPNDVQYAYDSGKILSNPILQWAARNKHYQQQAMKMKPRGGATEVKERAGVDLGSNSATIMDGTRKVSYYVPKASPVYLGANYHSDKFYTLPTTAARGISLNTSDPNAVKVLTEGMEDTVKRPPVISAIPTGYDAQNDAFTFDVRKDFANIGINGIESGTGMQIAVSRKALNNTDFLDSFVVLDESGKKVKIGDLAKTAKPTPAEKPKVNIGL